MNNTLKVWLITATIAVSGTYFRYYFQTQNQVCWTWFQLELLVVFVALTSQIMCFVTDPGTQKPKRKFGADPDDHDMKVDECQKCQKSELPYR